MNSAILCFVLVQCLTRVSSVTISSPAMQRRSIGESCTFRWNVTGNCTSYSINLFSTATPTVLGSNTNHTLNRSRGVITVFIWNIQTSDAGLYTLSVKTGPLTEVKSSAVLFVYAVPSTYTVLATGRNPSFEGDKIELNCSGNSLSLPVEYRTRMYYYTWQNIWYGSFRNITSGQAVLQNGDILPGFSIKNEGKTLIIASAQFTDNLFICSAQEEGSPYRSTGGYAGFIIYSKPYTHSFNPASRKVIAALHSGVNLYFYQLANPPLLSYTNWSFVNTSGSTEYPVVTNPITSAHVGLSFILNSMSSYGNYSITLTNSNGSTAETFQILPPGPPDTPSNFSVHYVTHSDVSLQWRCRWFNGAQQAVFVQLMGVANDVEVDTQIVTLATVCYNSVYNTLFQNNIQPETIYEANIWSVNSYGSSNVVKLGVRTPKRLSFYTSPVNISIMESQAAINFGIADSTKTMIRMNVTCCVEVTTRCSNKSYIIVNTEHRITFDMLPTGTQYVFDFIVYDSDGYTYETILAIMKGVRVSRTEDPRKSLPCDRNVQCVEKGNSLVIAVIVLAVLLGIVVLAFIGCLIGFLVYKYRQNTSHQQSTAAQPSKPNRSQPDTKEPSEYANVEDNYESMAELDLSADSAHYTALEETSGRAKANRYN